MVTNPLSTGSGFFIFGGILLNPDKPFLSVEQLIFRLKENYGLMITDEEIAKNALFRFSYYDLINGYQDVTLENGKFKKNISIEYLYMFYLFDKEFQNIIFKQSMMIENYFKNILAYYVSENCGVHIDDYLNPKYYSPSHSGVNFSALRANILNYNIYGDGAKQQPTKHYLKKHNHVPAWILFKNIDFGKSINLFTLLKNPMKTNIANHLLPYDLSSTIKMEFLINALNIIRRFRNKIAHNLKFVTYRACGNSLAPKTLTLLLPNFIYGKAEQNSKIGRNDIYSVILAMICLLQNDKYLTAKFILELNSHISVYNTDSENEAVKPFLFDEYSIITGLPQDLSFKLNEFHNYLLTK